MKRSNSLAAGVLTAVPGVVAQTKPAAKAAPAMARTEHQWQGAGKSSTFDALWFGKELKMIREEMTPRVNVIEKNEFMFNQNVLLHYKQDRYPESGKKGESVATMVVFDKTGKPSISMKQIDDKSAGPVSAAEIEQAKKHLAELQLILSKVKH